MSDSLQTLVDRAAFLSAEVQHRFGALIAGSDFDVDFSASPRLRFTGEQPIEFRPHMIGSSVDRRTDKTWHWGWDNLNDFPQPVIALSNGIREYGSKHGLELFTDPELPLDQKVSPLALTLAAKAATGAWAHYPVNAGGGTTVWVLIDDDRLALGEPALKPVVRAIASAITGSAISDHRGALAAYAELRGLKTAGLPDDGVRILCADGSADVTFDDAGRISSCQAHQPLEGEAADQYAAVGAVNAAATFGEALVDDEAARAQVTVAEGDSITEAQAPVEPEVPVEAGDQVDTGAPVGAEAEVPVEPAPPVESGAPEEPEATSASEEKKGFFKRLFGR